MGIYSLSKTYKDELMWAHYSSNHKGFCIEYDYSKLIKSEFKCDTHVLEIDYKPVPPDIKFEECINPTLKIFLQKMLGTKSNAWIKEDEIRIVTEKSGKHCYDFHAVTAIYFGYDMHDDHKESLISQLQGRDIDFYEIELRKDSYIFERKIREKEFKDARNYFGTFYRDNNNLKIPQTVEYKIIRQINQLKQGWGRIEILLEHKLTKSELRDLYLKIKDTIYGCIDDVTVNFFLDDPENAPAWAYAGYNKGKIDIQVIGLAID